MTPEVASEIRTWVTVLTGVVTAGVSIFGRIFADPLERAARRVNHAAATRDLLTASLPVTRKAGSARSRRRRKKTIADAELTLVREAIAFQKIAEDSWDIHRVRPWVLIATGVIGVAGFVAWRAMFPDVNPGFLLIQIGLYLAGCAVAGAGVLDAFIMSKRRHMDEKLKKLGFTMRR